MYIKSHSKTAHNPVRALYLKTAIFIILSNLKKASINGNSPIATAAEEPGHLSF
jgi:hypothetical protein